MGHVRTPLTTLEELRAHRIPRTGLWGRGVDTRLFTPAWKEDPETLALKQALAPGGEVLLGYVGRLAPEKELHRLVELAQLPGTRLVLVGEGPSRNELGAQRFDLLLSPERGRSMDNIQEAVNRSAKAYGAEIIDVRIKRADLPEGATVFAELRGRRIPATLVPMPFVSPTYKR